MRLEVKVLRILRDREASAVEIAEETLVNLRKIQETLNRLESLGLLKGAWRNGRKVYLHP